MGKIVPLKSQERLRRGFSLAAVSFERVSKVYPDGTRAVADLEIEIEDGEFMVLVGPSGCGKTTALRMVAGLEDISEGVVKIGERVVNNVAPKDRDIAMVFQSYALYPHLNVYDNIAFSLRLKREKDEIDRRSVHEAACILGLEAFSSASLVRSPAASGSVWPWAAPSSASPAGLLMDEPLSNWTRSPRPDACGDQPSPERSGDDDDLRHARSGRGHDDGRPHRPRVPAGR